MPFCAVTGCPHRCKAGEEEQMFCIPTVVADESLEAQELSSKRAAVWLSRINRKLSPRQKAELRICQRHFIKGRPAPLFSYTDPDWAPTLYLGYDWKGDNEARREKSREKSEGIDSAEPTCKKRTLPPTTNRGHNESNASHDSPKVVYICSGQRVVPGLIVSGDFKDPANARQIDRIVPEHSTADEAKLVDDSCTEVKSETGEEEAPAVDPERQEVEVKYEETRKTALTVRNLAELQAREVNIQGGSRPEVEIEELKTPEAGVACQQTSSLLERDVSTSQTDPTRECCDSLAELTRLRGMYAEQLRRNATLTQQFRCSEEAEVLKGKTHKLKAEEARLRARIGKLKLRCQTMSIIEESFLCNDAKAMFYTGLPSFALVKLVYDTIHGQVPEIPNCAIPKFTQYVITLMRLRLGLLEQDLAYRFNVALSTISRICSRWVQIMAASLEKLIVWPERSVILNKIPPDFKALFGDRCIVIVDCFEVYTSNAPDQDSQTLCPPAASNTAKFLIGVTPQGTVCFLSKSWDSRYPDTLVLLKSGILDKLEAGDVVLADRVLDIRDGDGVKRVKTSVPAFSKGETALSFDEGRFHEEIAEVRSLVHNISGFLGQKFRILESILPESYSNPSKDDEEPTIDRLVKVCCGLANICVAFDNNRATD